MISRILLLGCAIVLVLCGQAMGFGWQNTQSNSASQTSATSTQKTSSGQESVTGCVAREGEGFVLKTDNGTYEFNTARDLSPYVGKKVQISGRWTATGVTTTAPAVKAAATPGEAPAANAGDKAAPHKFVGDLHLHITGVVVGDCAQPQ
jgi:cytoskeletal protein RodZ